MHGAGGVQAFGHLLASAIGIAAALTPLPPRTPDHWVYDAAGVIDAGDESTIEQLSTELFRRTGVAIVVVTVPQLVDETIDELAVRVGSSWGVGRKGEDRGLVIAFARDDRKIYVATGYGTEGYLPDARVGAIIDRTALPDLRAGRYSAGLGALAAALAAESAREFGVELTGAPLPPPATSPQVGLPRLIGGVLMLLVFLYLLFRHPWMLLFLMSGGRRGGRGGFGGGGGHGGFGGGGFGGGGAGRDF
ncbi:MAG TPA: TPM domain-containing protein [Kofleriaceae bacterium]|nr:TPM domain-containing protein [Kofleriaceae bacterium]